MHLTREQSEFYGKNGYIKLSNILSEEEVKELSDEYDFIFQFKNNSKMESSWVGSDANDRVSNSENTVKGIHNLQHHSAVFTRLLLNPSLLDALEDIMCTKDIVLHHTKAHLKPPSKGAAYPMHQDYHYFPYKKDSLVAAFLHLDDANPENGGLFVYPGSHKLGPLEDVGTLESSFHYVDQVRFSISEATPVEAKRGDIIIFSYLLVHGSSPNISSRTRRMLLTQYMAADDEPIGVQPTRPSQGLVLRGRDLKREAVIAKRFEQ